MRYLVLVAEGIHITIERRPHYCDRGNWLAKLWPDRQNLHLARIDPADLWPRYYFDLDRGKAEIADWLERRSLRVLKDWQPASAE
jgi:hypothetical protein